MRMKLLTVAVLSSLMLSACGGGSSSSSTASAETGVLSDSYVKGVTYSAAPSGLAGATGSNGEFTYRNGDTVTFKLGNVTLGSVVMSNPALGSDNGHVLVRPKDLAGVTDEGDEKSLAIAQMLQTAANATPADTHIDVSANAGRFPQADTVESLTKAASLIAAAGLNPVVLEKVAEHLLKAPADVKRVEFTPTVVADANGVMTLSDANRTVTYTTSTVKVTYGDGTTKTFPLSYVHLFNNTDTNKTADGSAAAAIHDKNGALLKDAGNNPYIPQAPDANSLMTVGGNLFLVSHWEYENSNYGKLPMTMTLAKLDQAAVDGTLTVKAGGLSQVDFSGVNGLWIPCAGSRSPWNTHLGSEEYEPDARCEVDSSYLASSANCTAAGGDFTSRMNAFRVLYGDASASPYNYGRVPEVTVLANGTSTVQKWYTLGRLSREKAQFFSDSRTAIQGDDGTYTMLTMFVADRAGDLSAGTLYAAKWYQESADNTDGGKASLVWIKLGHASHADLKKAVDAGVKFDDLFDVSAVAAAGYTVVKHGHEVATTEYLKLKSGNFVKNGVSVPIATLAAFLETRRYGALMGATSEFEKMEGVAFNARDNKAYVAMTRMTKGMQVQAGDPVDDIRLKANNSGAVYQLALQAGAYDSDGNPINSRFVPASMEALVVGEDQVADAEGNVSKIEKISKPDNVAFSERMRVLFIGEDSDRHVNNFLWAYHVDTGNLVRILSLPMGAESTGLQVVDNMNGHAYIMNNYQHAGDQNLTVAATYNRIMAAGAGINVNKAEVGYLGGLPAMR